MAARENQDGGDFFIQFLIFFSGLSVKLLFQTIMGVSSQSLPWISKIYCFLEGFHALKGAQ